MFYRRCVFTFLVLSNHLTEWASVSAQGSRHRVPTHAYMLSGKTVFAFMNATANWNDAASICKRMYGSKGGSLARVDTWERMKIIKNLIGAHAVWIGIHWGQSTSGSGDRELKWDDAFCTTYSEKDYNNFQLGSDTYHSAAACIYVQYGNWQKVHCHYKFQFVCQYQDAAADVFQKCNGPPFSPEHANVYQVNVDALTEDACKVRCAGTLGCFFTKLHGQKCILGVVGKGTSTINFRNTCYDVRTVAAPTIGAPDAWSADTRTTAGTCSMLNETNITTTGTLITSDDPDEEDSDEEDSDSSEEEPIPECTSTLASTITETVTVTAEPSTEILTTTQFLMSSVVVTASCTDDDIVSVAPGEGPARETITITAAPAALVQPDLETKTPHDCGNSWPEPTTVFQTVCPTPSAIPDPFGMSTPLPSEGGNATNNKNCPTLKNITLNSSELERMTNWIVQDLLVDKDSLSKTRRKKECAPDKRTTAQTSGYFAIFCLSFTFGGFLLADTPVFFNQIRELVRKIK